MAIKPLIQRNFTRKVKVAQKLREIDKHISGLRHSLTIPRFPLAESQTNEHYFIGKQDVEDLSKLKNV